MAPRSSTIQLIHDSDQHSNYEIDENSTDGLLNASKDSGKDKLQHIRKSAQSTAVRKPYVKKGVFDKTCTRPREVSSDALKRYCVLLQETYAEFERSPKQSNLDASMIGSSRWTSREKHIFFDSIERYGRTEINLIASSVGTKTIAETQKYLSVLEQASKDIVSSRRRQRSIAVESPAALDVDDEQDLRLESLAQRVEQRLHRQACAADKRTYGKDWLIDLKSATAIETRLILDQSLDDSGTDHLNDEISCRSMLTSGQNRDNNESGSNHSSNDTIGHLPLTIDQTADDNDLDNEHINQKATPAVEESVDQSEVTNPASDYIFPSAVLLKPVSWIEMSRNVFMNSNESPDTRYDHIAITTSDSTGPSILRSAFDDFHEICIDYTKRLVHATHFQAMTRIRNNVKQRAGHITKEDVHTALAITGGSKPDQFKYWAETMEKYDIDVYSSRKGTRSGKAINRKYGDLLTKLELREALKLRKKLFDDYDHLQEDSTDLMGKTELSDGDNSEDDVARLIADVQQSDDDHHSHRGAEYNHDHRSESNFANNHPDDSYSAQHDSSEHSQLADDYHSESDSVHMSSENTPISDGDTELQMMPADEYEEQYEQYFEAQDLVSNRVERSKLCEVLCMAEQEVQDQPGRLNMKLSISRSDNNNQAYVDDWKDFGVYIPEWEMKEYTSDKVNNRRKRKRHLQENDLSASSSLIMDAEQEIDSMLLD